MKSLTYFRIKSLWVWFWNFTIVACMHAWLNGNWEIFYKIVKVSNC